MHSAFSVLSRAAAGIVLGVSLVTATLADAQIDHVEDTAAKIEEHLGARVGLAIVDTGSDFSWSRRPDERFLMNSTAKVPICAAILARVDAGEMSLTDTLTVQEDELLSYAPVTQERVGEDMSLEQLCLAALDQSDNTAANMLVDHLGGPQAVTGFFASIGDDVSRLDRREPELNDFVPDDPRDTTTPTAMAETLQKTMTGDALTAESQEKLVEWMSHGSVTGQLLRATAPADWLVADKSGSGSNTRNVTGMIMPEDRAAWIVDIYISDTDADFATRDAALQELSAAVVNVIRD